MPTLVQHPTAPVYDDEDMAPNQTSEQQLGRLAVLAEQQVELERQRDDAQEELKQAEGRLSVVRDNLLPDLMEELGLSNFKTKNGMKIDIKKTITASAGGKKDPERFRRVCAWLKENGHGGLVKRTIGLFFGVGEEEVANEFTAAIADVSEKFGKTIMDEAEIHAMTLSSFVREQLEAGVTIPEYFNVHRIRSAVVVQPK